MRRWLTATPLAAGGAAAAALAYGAGYEVRAFRLRRQSLAVLPPGSAPLRLLHLSDLHAVPGQERKTAFVRALALLEPDLVVDTGDNLAHRAAVPAAVRMLEPLFAFPGVFVSSSNDYHAPVPKNPLRYLLPDRGRRVHGGRLPWPDLRRAMLAAGWRDLTNERATLRVAGHVVAAAGVGDAHIRADRYQAVAGAPPAEATLRIGLSHSPEPRVLDSFAADGYDLVLSGHTHGGQVRVPGVGALVTNCGLDRGRARGLSRFGPMWLHVSAGLGTSPYAPVRFACPPEATLLTLVGR